MRRHRSAASSTSASASTMLALLPTEFQRHALEQRCCGHVDPASGVFRSGEVDHVDLRMVDQSGAGRSTGQHLHHTGRQTGFGKHLGQHQATGERRLGAGLSTTALPRAIAGASTRIAMCTGAFHAVMRPTTPTGLRSTMLTLPR